MAYGFKDYQADGIGGYEFIRDDGSPLHLFGPEADDLARRLDETRYQGATAQMVPMAPMPGGGISTPAGPVQPVQAPPPPEFGTTRNGSPRPQRPAPPAAPPAAPQAMVTPPEPPPEPRYWVPGTPGRDPMAERESGVMVPRGSVTTQTIEGEYSPEAAAERAKADLAIDQAMQTRAERDAAMYSVQSQEARKRATQLQEDEALQREQLQRAIAAADKQWGEVGKARDAYNSKEVDPRRYFKRIGTFGTIVSAIASGLGAYSAALTGGKNSAQAIINKAVDDDIAAQEADIDIAKDNKNSALAEYQKITGDRDSARSLLRNSMLAIADAERESWEGFVKSEQSRTAFDIWRAQSQAEAIERERQFKDAATGKKVIQLQNEFAQPQRGTPGRSVTFDELPVEQQLKIRKQELEAQELGLRGEEIRNKRRELEGGSRADPDKLEAYGEKKADVATFKNNLKVAAERIGATITPNGELIVPKDWDGVAGLGWTSNAPNAALTKEGRDARSDIGAVVSSYIKIISGAQATEQEQARLTKQIVGSWDSDVLTGLRRLISGVTEKEKAWDSAYDPAVREEYMRNQARVNRERNAPTPSEREDLP